ncbi:TPA: hypothetical protein GF726_03555 [Escherichia coli]|nr:hypothetical protein [Escherichia coli]EFN8497977.1 hypothetical protein [Escherichia coli]EFN8506101.1 hypothetical protein [Escherichia coli]HAH2564570.1 hypothetical protein [Escherichia coli]HAH2888322.1 hypothetical protein [Escherichia coli]
MFCKKYPVCINSQLSHNPVLARHRAIIKRRHGVSGVGGSNPLVPTKNPKKNQPLRLVFLYLQLIR